MLQRVIAFAGASVVVQYVSALGDVVDFLFRFIPESQLSALEVMLPAGTFCLEECEGELCLLVDGNLRFKGSSKAVLAECLLGDVCRALAEKSQGGLLFHAAALRWRDKGLLLPGGIGVGKTTLTAWLVTQGFTYLTDELVFVPYQSCDMLTFPRPLNVKQGAFAALHPYYDVEAHPDKLFRSNGAALIPAQHLSSSLVVMHNSSIDVVLFPYYETSVAYAMQPLSSAQAGLRLMQTLVNARNVAEYGFPEAVRLARNVKAYTLHYSDFSQLGDRMQNMMAM